MSRNRKKTGKFKLYNIRTKQEITVRGRFGISVRHTFSTLGIALPRDNKQSTKFIKLGDVYQIRIPHKPGLDKLFLQPQHIMNSASNDSIGVEFRVLSNFEVFKVAKRFAL